MDAVMNFLAMGKYAAYVWPSYGLTLVVMVGLLVVSLRGLKATEATFERLKAEVGPRERRRPAANVENNKNNNNNEESLDGDEAQA